MGARRILISLFGESAGQLIGVVFATSLEHIRPFEPFTQINVGAAA